MPCGTGAQVVADLVLKVAQQTFFAVGYTLRTLFSLRDLEDKVCYYLLPVIPWPKRPRKDSKKFGSFVKKEISVKSCDE